MNSRFEQFGGLSSAGGGPVGGGGGGRAFAFADVSVADLLVRAGLEIVREVGGPVRLWDFGLRLAGRLRMPPLPLDELCDAVKSTLAGINDDRLQVMAPGMPGVGYVYDAADPRSWPVRSSR